MGQPFTPLLIMRSERIVFQSRLHDSRLTRHFLSHYFLPFHLILLSAPVFKPCLKPRRRSPFDVWLLCAPGPAQLRGHAGSSASSSEDELPAMVDECHHPWVLGQWIFRFLWSTSFLFYLIDAHLARLWSAEILSNTINVVSKKTIWSNHSRREVFSHVLCKCIWV